ncbi:MAG: PIN domain-containing protein [Acidobacteriia bacterium]|nr:PIN domain-containing protein [Terriglobia bacterium]
MPVIALAEFLYGIGQSRWRTAYEGWLDANASLFIILTVERETARYYAEIRHELKTAGTPIPTNDLWIAAFAREHHLPILSRDAHFRAVRNLHQLTW